MIIKRQLYAAYAYSFFAFFGITQLWVVYLGQQGLSLVAVGLCESVFHIASFLFEIPSGVLADRFSYRRMLILSRGLALISSAMMLTRGGLVWFALSFVFSAWSYNLQSGTLEALLFESLLEVDAAKKWPEVSSRLNIVIEISSSFGLLLAGLMVNWHLALTYWLAIIFAVIGALTALLLHEPRQHEAKKRQPLFSIIKTAWQVLKSRPGLRRLMLFDALYSTIASGYYYYFQNVMTTRRFSTLHITLLLAATTIAAVTIIRFTPALVKLPTRRLLAGLTAGLAGFLLLCALGSTPLLSAMYLLIYALSALISPVFTVLYNTRIPSPQRATLLSVASLLYSLVMIGMFPLLGWLIQRNGFAAVFGGIGAILAAGLIAALLRMRLRA